ncbi:hypothetical protein L6164_036023 [Bauhinia variegata]|uniref:Uncharacterized protein n=1 Tax=Bauhinia variegata TaxID=167791 RepID=A0ACB9KFQ7_BAUVA|nr:hypothetical protein L6164_036023 [Bauhinia variegata]
MMRVVLGSLKGRSFFMVSVAALSATVFLLLFVSSLVIQKESEREASIKVMISTKRNRTVNTSRKLLQSSDFKGWNHIETACSKNNIAIYQGQVAPLPNGIPTYAVQIMNMCASDCSISHIHVHCGWFSSACLVNPRVFRRLRFDDCLVNDGKALGPGRSLFFKYSNTFPYHFSVSSVVC